MVWKELKLSYGLFPIILCLLILSDFIDICLLQTTAFAAIKIFLKPFCMLRDCSVLGDFWLKIVPFKDWPEFTTATLHHWLCSNLRS